MTKILPHTRAKLSELILCDLHSGQSAADSIAGRLKITKEITETLCLHLVAEGQLCLRHISISTLNDLPVYHLPNHTPPTMP
ncbi:MAG: hypothetical protein ACNA8L_10435 [Luteolibacter sp.]